MNLFFFSTRNSWFPHQHTRCTWRNLPHWAIVLWLGENLTGRLYKSWSVDRLLWNLPAHTWIKIQRLNFVSCMASLENGSLGGLVVDRIAFVRIQVPYPRFKVAYFTVVFLCVHHALVRYYMSKCHLPHKRVGSANPVWLRKRDYSVTFSCCG